MTSRSPRPSARCALRRAGGWRSSRSSCSNEIPALLLLRQATGRGEEAARRRKSIHLQRVRGDRQEAGQGFVCQTRRVARQAQAAAIVALLALILLCLAWELWLAPLRPGGSWLALKALPLALPLSGIFSGKRYTYQWSSMLILGYLAEGATRAWTDRGASQLAAAAEIVLSLAFFAAAVAFARLSRGR